MSYVLKATEPAEASGSKSKAFHIHYEEPIPYALFESELDSIRHGGHVWGKDVAIGSFAIMVPCALNAYDRYLSLRDLAISNFPALIPSLLNAVFTAVGLILVIIFGTIAIVSTVRVGATVRAIKNRNVVSFTTESSPGSTISVPPETKTSTS